MRNSGIRNRFAFIIVCARTQKFSWLLDSTGILFLLFVSFSASCCVTFPRSVYSKCLGSLGIIKMIVAFHSFCIKGIILHLIIGPMSFFLMKIVNMLSNFEDSKISLSRLCFRITSLMYICVNSLVRRHELWVVCSHAHLSIVLTCPREHSSFFNS
jgi:hypothetical protein